MRGLGLAMTAVCALCCVDCTGDREVLLACQEMSEHRRDCGFTDDGAWCHETASYTLTEAQRSEVFCVLDCYTQVNCDEIALEVCAEDLDTPAEECARECRAQSDLLSIPPPPAPCEEADDT